jgi:hypothetical protein
MINYTPPTKHTALFYRSEEEYFDVVIAFVRAGLENNEFVLWTVPYTMNVEDAKAFLKESVEELDHYIAKEQIVIQDKERTYFKDGVFTGCEMLKGLEELEKKVLQKGFKGIRGPGDASWALEDYWINFLLYEQDLNMAIESHNLRAFCTYSANKLDIEKIRDIGVNHQSSLVKQNGNWKRIEPAKFEK